MEVEYLLKMKKEHSLLLERDENAKAKVKKLKEVQVSGLNTVALNTKHTLRSVCEEMKEIDMKQQSKFTF